MTNPYTLPPDLPVPEDDGACDHLPGTKLPSLSLEASTGHELNVAELGNTSVLFIYPRTGRPGEELPTGWDLIPGARGCTPHSCGFRDLYSEFSQLGASVAGMSAQSAGDQVEFAERVHLPFPMLSDPDLKLADALGLPTFEVDGMKLYKRAALVAKDGTIAKVFYPVFPPGENASVVLAWLRG